jgi:hypothetical protein
MPSRSSSFRRQGAAARPAAAPVRFVELALPAAQPEAPTEGYAIAWPSGKTLRVPRDFELEEVALLLELLDERGGEEE